MGIWKDANLGRPVYATYLYAGGVETMDDDSIRLDACKVAYLGARVLNKLYQVCDGSSRVRRAEVNFDLPSEFRNDF